MSSEGTSSPRSRTGSIPLGENGNHQPGQGESSKAPYRHLPKYAFTSIEYPGPISHPSSILKVVSQEDINECFNANVNAGGNGNTNASSNWGGNNGNGNSNNRPLLEMRYRGNDESGGPVRGHRIPTQKLLLRIVKRRKKGKEKDEGVFTSEVLGSIPQTVRFRSMADYQWTPDPNGPTSTLIDSLKALDYNAILDYSFPPLDEVFDDPAENEFDPSIKFRSRLDLQPTPLFSTRNLPYLYNYKIPNQVQADDFFDRRTQTYKRRLINKSRTAGAVPINVAHNHKLGQVPKEPTNLAKSKMGELDPALLQKLRDMFEIRPVWMRHSLFSQFDEEERKELFRTKAYVPTVSYIMGTGPFWKCLVKFGYDPCADPESYKYQRIFFYPNKKTTKTPINVDPLDSEEEGEEPKNKGWWSNEQDKLIQQGERPPLDPKKAHSFDGKHLYRERGDYQLCDVTDPLIEKYINEKNNLQSKCSAKSGWFTSRSFTLIKSLVRTKYIFIWENHHPAPDSICQGIIDDYEKSKLNNPEDAEGDDGEEEEDEDDQEEDEDDDGNQGELEGNFSSPSKSNRAEDDNDNNNDHDMQSD
ncbi:uncharacterized protein IL334_004179 [Kwoniella shivajii]|uniref:Transcription factor IIIC subunit 5 HTH domain-containing protein n=1 Tax=Kwoniella shivajii TaxID=564305 RepID=A0ABZ1D079_9TREE|nr:hypothetical protein IL334_004179 [Kwoniella shivajii]